MKTIIAPTDFSPISLNAVDYAADMALCIGANLNILHVYSIPVTMTEGPLLSTYLDDIEEEVGIRLSAIKEQMLNRLQDKIIIHVEAKLGDVVTEIEQYSNRLKPYAVVMGTESADAVDRFFLGARSFKAMNELEWPLILVPADTKFKDIKKIGFACDFRDVNESVHAEEIKQLVKEFNAELHILYVRNEPSNPEAEWETEIELRRLRKMLGATSPTFHYLTHTNIEDAIIEFAEQNKLDLLIIIPKNHDFISRLFRHSHSRHMVLHAHIPIMTIHE
ncbi:universal stress protein [Asinibacterium sp. OR53]|uniref:universal stress protein n=1 Tax=Asinibacterium sp. OR53 TaxID=925409 RepID=UPI00047A90D1|nr:universal stress protein [Asinibacterium sp. OR53]